MASSQLWWKEGTVYQIYPSSFLDSNGDGIGDIAGIISKLDYLKDLGVDIIWLSPHYKSPQVDMGYDISDYKDIHEPYGTLEDCQGLIDGCHERGMKIIFDLVVNHTSDQHKWFLESKKSKDNAKRNWYIWKDAKYDENGNRQPPNNWANSFGGSAWEWDETTQQYYLHLFCKEQPDLNWEEPVVREAIYADACNFWLERGVDGFRIDTVGLYSKHQDFPDAPIVDPGSAFQPGRKYYFNGPRIHEFLREMYDAAFGRFDCYTVGELGLIRNIHMALDYVGAKRKELSEVFLFDVVLTGRMGPNNTRSLDRYGISDWKLPEFKKNVSKLQVFIQGTDGWTTSLLENHDQPRSVSRFTSDDPKYRAQGSKLLATLLAALSGTLYLYQGQEIGMTNFARSWPIEEYRDVASRIYYHEMEKRYGPERNEKSLDNLQKTARDHSRTPVQWDDSENGGFTTGKPWMRVNDNYKEVNVESQINDPNSVLSYWRRALKIRKKYKDLFVYGTFQGLDLEDEKTFTFIKEYEGKKAFVALNFTVEKQFVKKPEGLKELKLVISTVIEEEVADILGPYEGRIYIEA